MKTVDVQTKKEATTKSLTLAKNIKVLKDRGFPPEAINEGLALYLSYQVAMPSMELDSASAVDAYMAQNVSEVRQLISEANEVCMFDAKTVYRQAARMFQVRHDMAFTPARAALAIDLASKVSEDALHAFNQFTRME